MLIDTPRILIVEPDAELRDLFIQFFRSAGHRPFTASPGAQTLSSAAAEPELVVFHLGDLNTSDGQSIRDLRRLFPHAEIIVLSYRTDIDAKVTALDDGADDFLTMPVDLEELGARARARLRRSVKAGRTDRPVRIGAFAFDAVNHSVTTIDGRSVALSRKEFELFQLFAQNPDVVLPHRFLLSRIWSEQVDSQYVRVYVSQLRSKLEPDPAKPRYIITVPGRGYLFRSDRSDPAVVVPVGKRDVLAIDAVR